MCRSHIKNGGAAVVVRLLVMGMVVVEAMVAGKSVGGSDGGVLSSRYNLRHEARRVGGGH